jgi:hypothetical protein
MNYAVRGLLTLAIVAVTTAAIAPVGAMTPIGPSGAVVPDRAKKALADPCVQETTPPRQQTLPVAIVVPPASERGLQCPIDGASTLPQGGAR